MSPVIRNRAGSLNGRFVGRCGGERGLISSLQIEALVSVLKLVLVLLTGLILFLGSFVGLLEG